MSIKQLFKISKEERPIALLLALFFIALNSLNVIKYFDRFSQLSANYHDLFWNNYHVSGFDLITYHSMSEWDVRYEATRHPLMAYFIHPLYMLNKWLMSLTGSNWATTITAIVWCVSAIYSFVFLYRILRQLMSLSKINAVTLCLFFYSMGFTMLAVFVPDHFGPSMTMLLLTIYIVGDNIKNNRETGKSPTAFLFLFTAGISLSNGIKVFIATLTNRGKAFWHPKFLGTAVILPSLLILGVILVNHHFFVTPRAEARKQVQAIESQRMLEELRRDYLDTATVKNPEAVEAAVRRIVKERAIEKYRYNRKQAWSMHAGKPISKEGFAAWTDISTPRWKSFVENIFGEPIQFHEDYFLDDVNIKRPVIVNYNHWYNYAVEGIILLLAIIGIMKGYRNKVIPMVLAFFSFDLLIHLVLGFGLNEVYIMSPHYLFIIPICISPLLKDNNILQKISMTTIAMLTLWLYNWNLSLLLPWFGE